MADEIGASRATECSHSTRYESEVYLGGKEDGWVYSALEGFVCDVKEIRNVRLGGQNNK